MKLNNVVTGFAILATLLSMLIFVYQGMETTYGVVADDEVDGQNIMQALNQLHLINGSVTFSNAVQQITSPDNPLDLLGGLLAAGIGAAKSIMGIVILPADIVGIVLVYYVDWIPPQIKTLINLLFGVYLSFILLRYYTKVE